MKRLLLLMLSLLLVLALVGCGKAKEDPDADAADARIHAVGQREVNDAELATKINRRFGPPVSEFMQAATAPTRQHQCDSPSGQLERATIIHFLTPR